MGIPASQQIREFLSDNGPSTWAEIQAGTKLSKGTLTAQLNDTSRINSTETPSTLYNALGLSKPKTVGQVVRHMLMTTARIYRAHNETLRREGKQAAEAKTEVALIEFISRYGKLLNNDNE